MKKLIAILVAFAMAAMLSITAFAADPAHETLLANARIKKTFIIPEGVKDPKIVATFTFTGNDSASSGLQDGEHVPAIADPVTITYTGTGNQTEAAIENVQFAALPSPAFPHAGVYVYTVAENEAVASETTDTDFDVTETGGPYTVRYYVENNGQSGTTVKYITVESEDGKVESFIDEDDSEDWTDGDDSNFEFKNVYTVKDGTDDPDPEDPTPTIDPEEAALKVSKAVTAVEGQTKPAESANFPFTITITPAAGQEETVLKAWKIDSTTGAVIGNAATPYLTITGAGSADFTLKDGETLAFANAPAGTRWTVEETLGGAAAWNAYTPKYDVTSAGSTIAGTQVTKDAGAGLSLKTEGETTPQTYLLAANKNDAAAYTNKYDNSINTPTGILISNLPYIALALVAIGGLVAYVVVRRRQDNEA